MLIDVYTPYLVLDYDGSELPSDLYFADEAHAQHVAEIASRGYPHLNTPRIRTLGAVRDNLTIRLISHEPLPMIMKSNAAKVIADNDNAFTTAVQNAAVEGMLSS